MCQLLGMNANTPTDICFSFHGFRLRGGETDEHADGWGIAFYEDRGCRLFLDYQASAKSPLAELLDQMPIHSTHVIAHIRKATHGPVALANTHPFQRELWGRYWIFAHNGTLKPLPEWQPHFYHPVGSTDSEQAFCWLLERLRQRFASEPEEALLLAEIAAATRELAANGSFNMMLSNGEWLVVHCSTSLHHVLRQAPFRHAHLVDEDISIDFNALTQSTDRVAVVATLPLTDNEEWVAMQAGEMLAFKNGLATPL